MRAFVAPSKAIADKTKQRANAKQRTNRHIYKVNAAHITGQSKAKHKTGPYIYAEPQNRPYKANAAHITKQTYIYIKPMQRTKQTDPYNRTKQRAYFLGPIDQANSPYKYKGNIKPQQTKPDRYVYC